MKFRGEKAKNHRKAQSLMSVKALQRARRRYGGEELPVTCFDEELTGETIYNITCDFERGTRLSLLASAIGSLVAVARPFEDRTQHMIDIPRLLRKHVKDIATIPEYCKRPIKNGGSGVAGLNVCGGFIDPSDISLADAAFDRALRRRAGESLEITKADLDGTFALIRQLMTDIDWIALIIVTAKAIVEEYDGAPPDGVLVQLEGLIRKIVTESDVMNLSYEGPMN